MWVVVGNALAARRGQAVVIALVALLAAAAVAVAPWYAAAATQQVGVAAVTNAPIGERLISATWEAGAGESAPPDPAVQFRQLFAPAAFTSVVGAVGPGEISSGAAAVDVTVAFREGVCEHVALTGTCPSVAGEVALPAATAEGLGVEVGDELQLARAQATGRGSVRTVPVTVWVVGVYDVVDPGDPYWADGSLVGPDERTGAQRPTVLATLEALTGSWVTYTYDLLAVPQGFADADLAELGATLTSGLAELERQGFTAASDGVDALIDRVARDRQRVTAGVGVGVAVLLLLTWFTLGIALREVVVNARGDLGWSRLRGLPPRRAWVLVLAQSTIPLLVGAVVGGAVGIGLGSRLGTSTEEGGAALRAVALVGLTVAGGLVAAVVAQFGVLRAPLSDLLRRVPARRSRWRRSVADVVLVVLAVAAVGQALVLGHAATGLAVLAPALAVFALVVMAAWVVPPVVSWLAARALRAGRLPVALVAAAMARRAGTHRLFALVAVAVALATTAVVGVDTTGRTNGERAELEAGADRVITVATTDGAQLLAAVRAVDPSGTAAMAAIHRPGSGDRPPTLAVDSTRLGVVTGWRDEYGGDIDDVAAALRPDTPGPVVLATSRLEVEAAAADPAGAVVWLGMLLQGIDTGEAVQAVVGPLAAEAGTYAVDVPCTGDCRLVGVELLGGAAGAYVELYRVSGSDDAATATLVTEPTRWRPALGPTDLGLTITAADGGLRLTVPQPTPGGSLQRADWAFVVDSPTPLPAVAAGWWPDPSREVRLAPLSGVALPVQVAGRASLLPRLGQAGLLMDLESAQRLDPLSVSRGTGQVWLSSSAPDSIVDDLRAAGLTPLRQDALADHEERLGAQGSAVGVRFQAAVALVGLLLVAGTLLVHAVQGRAGRAAELAALRVQGIDASAVRAVGYGGLAGVVGAASVVGIAVGIIGAVLARRLHPGFVDGWAALPAAAMRPAAIVAVTSCVVVVLGAVVLAGGRGVVRRIGATAPGRPT